MAHQIVIIQTESLKKSRQTNYSDQSFRDYDRDTPYI